MSFPKALQQIALPVLIVGLSLVLRLWYVTALPGQGGEDVLFSDMRVYDYTGWSMAQALPVSGRPGLNGFHPLSASTYLFAGYTFFLAAIYSVFGHDLFAVRVIQAVLSAATVGVVYLVGSLCFSRWAGLVAATLTAVYLPLVYYAGLLLTETWFIFLQMTALVLWLWAWCGRTNNGEISSRATNGPRAGIALFLAVAAGLIAGMACLTRAAFVLAVLTFAAGGLFFPPVAKSRGRRLSLVAAFLSAAATVIAPITVRNYQIHGRFILISTNGPSTFLTGHMTHEAGLPAGLPPRTTDAQMAELHRARCISYLENHWRTYLAEIPEFFAIIWMDDNFWPATGRTFSNTTDAAEASLDSRIHPWGSPPFGRATYFPDLVRYSDRLVWCLLGLPMGLLAVLFLPCGHRRWNAVYLALVPYVVIPFIASAFPRYRMPAVPLVFVLAGQPLAACWKVRRRLSD
jgi:4-amino-4-deoxy-L-arabinose transferase-like glycosyltransferase